MAQSDSASESHRQALWAPLLTAVVTLVVFAPLLRGGFDHMHIGDAPPLAQHPFVRSPSGAGLRTLFVEGLNRSSVAQGRYQPLAVASLMLDSWFSGGSSAGGTTAAFHRTQALLHAANAALACALFAACGARRLAAVALALLFACHPVQVESVAWNAQRGALLAAGFGLAAMLTYIRGHVSAWPGAWFLGCSLAYVCSVLSDPIALPLPLVMLLLDRWPLRRLSWATVLEKLPLLALMSSITWIALTDASGAWPEHPLAFDGLAARAGRLLAGYSSLLMRLIWPAQLTPLPLPAHSTSSMAARLAIEFAPACLIAAIVAVGCRRWRSLTVGCLAFTVLIAPRLALHASGERLPQDHVVYFPLALLLLGMVEWLSTVAWRRRFARLLTVGVLAGAAVLTRAQIPAWRNAESILRHMLAVRPNHPAALAGLSERLIATDRLAEALQLARDAAGAEPAVAEHWRLLGSAALASGLRDEALSAYRRALAAQPEQADYLHGVAAALSAAGRYAESLPYYEKAVSRAPRSEAARMGLGFTYLELDRPASARDQFQRALELGMNLPLLHFGLACAWSAMDMKPQCRAHLAAAVAADRGMAQRAARDRYLARHGGDPAFAGLIGEIGDAGPSASAHSEAISEPASQGAPVRP